MPIIRPPHRALADLTLDDVRAMVKETRERGLQIQRHYKRLEQEYSDWEDEIVKIQKIIDAFAEETGADKEDILEDKGIFNGINEVETNDDDIFKDM